MKGGKLGVFANLALAANAVLVPPSITGADFGDDKALETLAIDPFQRTVALECPGCDYAVLADDKTVKWKTGVGNTFLLSFDVGPNQDVLNVDGIQMFPPAFRGMAQDIRVTQVDPTKKDDLRLRVTGYAFSFNGGETVSEAGSELLPMNLKIKSIEDKAVDLPELTINVLKTEEGRLMIASFQASQEDKAPSKAGDKECNEWPLLCKWKSVVANRLEQWRKMGKGCGKRPHGHGRPNPMEEETFAGKPPHRFRPGRPHDHPHHRPHHHKGDERHGHNHQIHIFLRRAFFTVLVPVLIGVFVGTLTYLVGMAIGCLLAITIAKVRGQDYQRIALEDDEEDVEAEAEERTEKEEYAELPAYEAPPRYEDDTKPVDESK